MQCDGMGDACVNEDGEMLDELEWPPIRMVSLLIFLEPSLCPVVNILSIHIFSFAYILKIKIKKRLYQRFR